MEVKTELSESALAVLRSRVRGGTRAVDESNLEAYRRWSVRQSYVRRFGIHQRAGVFVPLDGRRI